MKLYHGSTALVISPEIRNANRPLDYGSGFYIVFGPVANDRVYTAFTLYEGGVLDKPSLIQALKYGAQNETYL